MIRVYRLHKLDASDRPALMPRLLGVDRSHQQSPCVKPFSRKRLDRSVRSAECDKVGHDGPYHRDELDTAPGDFTKAPQEKHKMSRTASVVT